LCFGDEKSDSSEYSEELLLCHLDLLDLDRMVFTGALFILNRLAVMRASLTS